MIDIYSFTQCTLKIKMLLLFYGFVSENSTFYLQMNFCRLDNLGCIVLSVFTARTFPVEQSKDWMLKSVYWNVVQLSFLAWNTIKHILLVGLHVNLHNKTAQELLLNANRPIQLKIDFYRAETITYIKHRDVLIPLWLNSNGKLHKMAKTLIHLST